MTALTQDTLLRADKDDTSQSVRSRWSDGIAMAAGFGIGGAVYTVVYCGGAVVKGLSQGAFTYNCNAVAENTVNAMLPTVFTAAKWAGWPVAALIGGVVAQRRPKNPKHYDANGHYLPLRRHKSILDLSQWPAMPA